MKTRLAALAGGLPILLALAFSGCGSARRGEPFGEPLRFTEESLRRGHVSFMRHCNQCHPQGEGGLAPSLNEKPLPGWMMRAQVRKGFGPMPAFSAEEIPDGELDDLIAFLNRLQDGDGT